jgi:hypothetical protein
MLAAGLEAVGVLLLHAGEGLGEVAGGEAVEEHDADVEVRALAEPVVQQLVGAAVDVARGEDDVLVADEVRERGVDRAHAGVEVPGHVFARHGTRLDVHDVVRERDGGRVHQPRVDLVQELAALEGVVDPLGARVEVGRGAGDDRRGREDRRDVVEGRVGALRQHRRVRVAERLVGLARRVLQGVEELRQLEREEFLGVEEGEAVLARQAAELAGGRLPEVHHVAVRAVEFLGEGQQRLAGLDCGSMWKCSSCSTASSWSVVAWVVLRRGESRRAGGASGLGRFLGGGRGLLHGQNCCVINTVASSRWPPSAHSPIWI